MATKLTGSLTAILLCWTFPCSTSVQEQPLQAPAPLNCDLVYTWFSTNVHCSGVQFSNVQSEFDTFHSFLEWVPENTTLLSVKDSNISVVYAGTFRRLASLKELILSRNGIEQIQNGAFSGLPHLQVLLLDDNALESIESRAFHGLGNLETLHLGNNRLRNISDSVFRPLIKLRSLLIANNRLNGVNCQVFKGLTQVWALSLSKNNISTFEQCTFTHMTGLMDLDLSDNVISELPEALFQFNPSTFGDQMNQHALDVVQSVNGCNNTLASPTLSGNQFSDIPSAIFGCLNRLKYLDLSANPIYDIEGKVFVGLRDLQQLVLSHMSELVVVEPRAFIGLRHLTSLTVRGNRKLAAINPDVFADDKPTHLQMLDLSGNDVMSFQEALINYFPVLRHARLSQNLLHCNCELAWMVNVASGTTKPPWIKSWSEERFAPRCHTPKTMRGVKVADIPLHDLTCADPIIQPITEVLSSVRAGYPYEIKALMWRGRPTGHWNTPQGVPLHPRKRASSEIPSQGGIIVDETVMQETNQVITTLTIPGVTSHSLGGYTLIATNADGAATLTFTLEMEAVESVGQSETGTKGATPMDTPLGNRVQMDAQHTDTGAIVQYAMPKLLIGVCVALFCVGTVVLLLVVLYRKLSNSLETERRKVVLHRQTCSLMRTDREVSQKCYGTL